MLNEPATVSLIFNGEIYNHAEVRRELEALATPGGPTTPTPRCCSMPTRSGASTASGNFTACGASHLRRPRPGQASRPSGPRPGRHQAALFHPHGMGEWLFASEIRALLAHPHVPAEMDPVAFWHYLTFIVAPAPLTMFRGIFKLPAGHDRSRSITRSRDIAAVLGLQALRRSGPSRRRSCVTRKRSPRLIACCASPSDAAWSPTCLSACCCRAASIRAERRAYERADGAAGHDVHDRLRDDEDFNEFDYARRIAQRYRTDHHETRIAGRKRSSSCRS